MKIIYITNVPSPYKVDFFNELSKSCELTVIYERSSASDREKNWVSKENRNYEIIFLNGIELGTDKSISFGIIRHLQRNKYDVIIFGVYASPSLLFAMQYLNFKKIPFILSSDGGFPKKDNKLAYTVKKHFISMPSLYLSPGGETKDYLIKYGASEKNIYWYPFTSLKREDILNKGLTPTEKQVLRKKLGILGDKVLFSVGQMIPRKGFDLLLKSMVGVPQGVSLYIAGGEPTNEMMDIIKENNLANIHFIGFKSKNELFEFYQASDFFVFPTREDIWGLVVNEALANGLPVIGSDESNAVIQLIKNGYNGFTFKSEDISSLNQILSGIKELSTGDYSENAIESINNWDYINMAKQHIEISRKFLESK